MKWPSFLKVKKGPQVQKLSIFLTQSKLLSHSAEKWEIHSYPFFPSNQLFSNFFSENVDFTQFFGQNNVRVILRNFHTVCFHSHSVEI